MGNRCVITTKDKKVGVYLHWNGGRDSVQGFLTYCKLQNFRSPEYDNYGWARLCQVCANFFNGGLCIGIDQYENLDYDNGDNGVYIIENWEIVGREYFEYSHEQDSYDLYEVLVAIDESQPEDMQMAKNTNNKVEFFKSLVSKE